MQSINQRKDRYRQTIRKVEREAFFLQERMKMMATYERSAEINAILGGIRKRQQLPEVLEELIRIINGANNKSDMYKLIEKGLLHELLACLRDHVCPKLVLEAISYLLQQTKETKHAMNLYQRFYNLNLLQYLLEFVKNTELTNISAFIIYDYSEASPDYCEALTLGNGYKTLIDIFTVRSNYGYTLESDPETNRYFKYILHTLENIIMIDSNQDYHSQKIEVYDFIVALIQRRLFLRPAFGVFYQCIRCIGSSVAANQIQLINDVLYELKFQSKFFQNLLASIYLLTPNQKINYEAVFEAAIKVPKLYKLISLIFEKMIKQYQSNKEGKFLDRIPVSEDFWQRLIIHQEDEATFRRLLSVLEQIKIEQDFMFRVISGSLDNISTCVQKDLLHMLHDMMVECKNPKQVHFFVDKHCIAMKLEPLTTSKNALIKQRANMLLEYILGPLVDMSSRIE